MCDELELCEEILNRLKSANEVALDAAALQEVIAEAIKDLQTLRNELASDCHEQRRLTRGF